MISRYVKRYVIRIYSPYYIRHIVMHRRSVWRFIVGYSAVIMASNSWSISHYIVVVIWRLYPTLLYRSYKRVIDVLYRVGRLGIACMLSSCYALIWRLYAVVWRVYGVLWRSIAHGYAVMAYGLGLRDRHSGVACVVGCVYGVYPLGYSVLWRGLASGYGVYVW